MQSTRSLRVRPLDIFHSGYCSLYLFTDVDDDEDIFISWSIKDSMGGGDELAKEPVSSTIPSYDENSSKPAENGKMRGASDRNGPGTVNA